MRARFINEAKYWDESSPYMAEYQEFWEELVPREGEADTLQGELLRMISRISYDYYNNGFGNDRSEEAQFLNQHANLFKPQMRDPNIWDTFYSLYEDIAFGNDTEFYKKVEDEYGSDYDDEDDFDPYSMDSIEDYIKRNHWDVEKHLDEIMDGVVKYIRLSKHNLEPLH